MRSHLSRWRWVVVLAVFAMVAAACQSQGGSETTTTTSGAAATTTTTAAGPTTTAAPAGFTYKMGIFEDIKTTNWWAFPVGSNNSVWTDYVLGLTKPALFGPAYPGLQFVPSVAADLPAQPVQDGSNWTVTQKLRKGYMWSDGTELTADDIVFTYNALKDTSTGGQWLTWYPYTQDSNPQLTDVQAPDPYTVVFTFNAKPGLAVWPHNVGTGPIMQKKFWQSKVDDAKTSEDPAKALASADASGDPSGGPVTFDSWQEGAFAKNVANDNYYYKGATYSFYDDGTFEQDTAAGTEKYYGEGTGTPNLTYKDGPYATEDDFVLYGDQSAALLALKNNEVDFLLNPLGMQRGLLTEAQSATNLQVVVNPTNGFRYLAFNMRQSPGSYLAFRQAMAYMIDKEYLTTNVLQGVAFPLYVTLPEGNKAWYNKEYADSVAAQYKGLTEGERLKKAVDLLTQAGFKWKTAAEFNDDGTVKTFPQGLIDPTGKAVPKQTILAPPSSYDPLRATAALWIAEWYRKLGVDAVANPTDFNALVSAAFPGPGSKPSFDAFILGWSLGDPTFPNYMEDFFGSKNLTELNDGDNSPGFQNAQFDQLSAQYNAAETQQQAYDIFWQQEKIIDTQLPYIVLFDTPIIEFYNKDVTFPFTSTLSGLQALRGMQGAVTK